MRRRSGAASARILLSRWLSASVMAGSQSRTNRYFLHTLYMTKAGEGGLYDGRGGMVCEFLHYTSSRRWEGVVRWKGGMVCEFLHYT